MKAPDTIGPGLADTFDIAVYVVGIVALLWFVSRLPVWYVESRGLWRWRVKQWLSQRIGVE